MAQASVAPAPRKARGDGADGVGPDGTSEHALGGYTTASGGGDLIHPGGNIYALGLQNTTDATIGSTSVNDTGEQWQGHFNPGNGNALNRPLTHRASPRQSATPHAADATVALDDATP